jgi:hypothetical protein
MKLMRALLVGLALFVPVAAFAGVGSDPCCDMPCCQDGGCDCCDHCPNR